MTLFVYLRGKMNYSGAPIKEMRGNDIADVWRAKDGKAEVFAHRMDVVNSATIGMQVIVQVSSNIALKGEQTQNLSQLMAVFGSRID